VISLLSLCVSVSIHLSLLGNCPVAMQRLGKHVSVAANTRNSRKNVGRIVFYAIRVVSWESRRLVLPRICCLNSASTVCIVPRTRDIWFIARQKNNFFVLIIFLI
jgi:hypothetical protein